MPSWTQLNAYPYLCAACLRKQLWILWLGSAAVRCPLQESELCWAPSKVTAWTCLWFCKETNMQSASPLHCWSGMSCFRKHLISLNRSQVLFSSILTGSLKRCNVVSTPALAMMTTDSVLINQLSLPFLLLWSHLYFSSSFDTISGPTRNSKIYLYDLSPNSKA